MYAERFDIPAQKRWYWSCFKGGEIFARDAANARRGRFSTQSRTRATDLLRSEIRRGSPMRALGRAVAGPNRCSQF